MAKGGKRKGKNYEDKIADVLHEYLLENNDKYNELFTEYGDENIRPKRDSSSGVFKTSDGDINLGIAKKFFPYAIECKHHADFSDLTLNNILKGSFKKILGIWTEQCLSKAKQRSLQPLLIFKGNRTLDFVMINKNSVQSMPETYFMFKGDVIIMRLDEFLTLYKGE